MQSKEGAKSRNLIYFKKLPLPGSLTPEKMWPFYSGGKTTHAPELPQ